MSRIVIRERRWAVGLVLCACELASAQAVYFRRGDANNDSNIDLSDSIASLNFLFSGAAKPSCMDAADANDDGKIDISDAVYGLAYLFLGGPAPPAPGPLECGYDPTRDDLHCGEYFSCFQPIVFFEVIDGVAVTQGDISIGKPEDVPTNIIGIGRGGAYAVNEGCTFLFWWCHERWQNGIVPFTMDANVNQSDVLGAISHWETNTSIRFVNRTNEDDYVHFRRESDCHSDVGRTGGEQVISLGPGCTMGNAIHEIGHALGLWHEQSRPDRDNYIKIHYENIKDGLSGQFDKEDGVAYCSPYDYGSIMHYPEWAFSDNGKSTIETIPPGIPIGQRSALSAGDIDLIQYLYSGSSFYSGWNPMGGPVKSSPAVGRNQDGRLEFFVVGDDDTLWQRWQLAPNSDWSGWNSLLGTCIGNPGVGSNADGRLEVFVRGPDLSVWERWQVVPNGDWSDWSPVFVSSKSDIAVGRNEDGRLEIFFVGLDDAVWHKWQTTPNGSWSDVESLSGIVAGTPGVGTNQDGRLELFVRSTDGSVWQNWQVAPNSGWSGWYAMGGFTKSDVGVGRNADGRLEIFVVGGDDALYNNWQLGPNSSWSGWAPLGGQCLPDTPAVGLNSNGLLEVFVHGSDTGIWHKWQLPWGGWTDWSSLLGSVVDNVHVGTNADGRLEMFARAPDGTLYQKWQTRCAP